MRTLKEVSSGEARQQWRAILDTVMTGDSDVTISRHGQAIAVLIPAEDYEALKEDLEELRGARHAEEAYEDYLANRDSSRPYEEIRSEILD